MKDYAKVNDRKVRSKWKHQIIFLMNSGTLNPYQRCSAFNKLQIIDYIKMAFHLKGINEEEFNKLYYECTRALYFVKKS